MGVIRRLKGQCGFSLAESLFVLLLLSMVSSAMLAGVLFAPRQYARSMELSQSRILSSTLRSAVSTELSNGEGITVENGELKTFLTQNYLQSETNDSFENRDGKLYLNGMPLISAEAYSQGLRAELDLPIRYDRDSGVFHVKLTIYDSKRENRLEESVFDVVLLNPE